MEQRHLCANTDNENVKKFALALMNAGITDGAECYYTDEGFSSPFFKIFVKSSASFGTILEKTFPKSAKSKNKSEGKVLDL